MTDKTEDQAAASPAAEPPKSLETLLAEAQAKLEEQRNAWLRAVADAENARKRAQADVQAAHKFAVEKLSESLLPVMDSLEAAFGVAAEGAPAALRDGIEITVKQLKAAFQKAGLAEIAPAVGERFDPHRHQAMAAVESAAEPNSIVAVMVKGYALHDRVVRPALVTVAKALENKEKAPTSDGNPASN